MVNTTFHSNRIDKDVIVVMTHTSVFYITNDTHWIIDRDKSFHMTQDGLDRAIDTFEDVRFNSWYGFNVEEVCPKRRTNPYKYKSTQRISQKDVYYQIPVE